VENSCHEQAPGMAAVRIFVSQRLRIQSRDWPWRGCRAAGQLSNRHFSGRRGLMFARQLLGNRLFMSGALIIGVNAPLAVAAPGLAKVGVLRLPVEQPAEGLDADGMPLRPSRR